MYHSFEYRVVGQGRFPLDMLRYDGAFPMNSEDAVKIGSEDRENREVRLIARQASRDWQPCAGRWASFGWRVYPVIERWSHGKVGRFDQIVMRDAACAAM